MVNIEHCMGKQITQNDFQDTRVITRIISIKQLN